MTTMERVVKIVADHMDVAPDRVLGSAKIMDDLGADSLDAIELTIALEEEFDVEINDMKASEWVTIGQVIEGLDALIAENAPKDAA